MLLLCRSVNSFCLKALPWQGSSTTTGVLLKSSFVCVPLPVLFSWNEVCLFTENVTLLSWLQNYVKRNFYMKCPNCHRPLINRFLVIHFDVGWFPHHYAYSSWLKKTIILWVKRKSLRNYPRPSNWYSF